MDVRLYVGNLAKSTTEAELKTLFTQAGSVAAVDMVKDRNSGEFEGLRLHYDGRTDRSR